MTNHKKRQILMVFYIAMLLGFSQSALAGKTKVITLVEELEMTAGESIDLEPIKVAKFKFASLLGTHSGGFVPVEVRMAFTAVKALATEPVPRSRVHCNIAGGPDGGVVFCDYTGTGRPLPLRIQGPYLAVRLVNVSGSDVTVNLKVFLSK